MVDLNSGRKFYILMKKVNVANHKKCSCICDEAKKKFEKVVGYTQRTQLSHFLQEVNRLSTSNEMSLPLLVKPLTKIEKSTVDLRCMSETWPRFRVRILPKYPAKLDVGEWELLYY